MSSTNPMNDVTVNTGYSTGTVLNSDGTTTTQQSSSTINNDQFLKLLITELKNQDPSSAVNTSDLMQQTSQLSSMEAMQNMQTAMTTSTTAATNASAVNMLGKTITANSATGGADIVGVVTGVSLGTSGPTLKIGDMEVPMTSVKEVSEASPSTSS